MRTLTADEQRALDEHRQSLETLHRRLSSMPGVDKVKLQAVLDKYKTATLQFHEDVLGCMN